MAETKEQILAWLSAEQRKAERWRFSNGDTGVFRFGLSGPELMRIRHALGEPEPSREWQCRFVADDKRCCQLSLGHDGEHAFQLESSHV